MVEGEDCDVESFLECDERIEDAEPGICGQSWSHACSPSFADSDRRESTAGHQEDQQGGLSESKPLSIIFRRSCSRLAGSKRCSMGGVLEMRLRRLPIHYPCQSRVGLMPSSTNRSTLAQNAWSSSELEMSIRGGNCRRVGRSEPTDVTLSLNTMSR